MNKKSSCALSCNPTCFFLVGAFVVVHPYASYEPTLSHALLMNIPFSLRFLHKSGSSLKCY